MKTTINGIEECPECGGNGYHMEPSCGELNCCYELGEKCENCNGTGEVYNQEGIEEL